MIPCKPIGRRLIVFCFSFFVFSVVNNSYAAGDPAAGKAVFLGKCAACHNVFKDGTGPALMGMEERSKWADHNELLKWINNPAAYMANDAYTQGLKAKYGSMMTGFADVTLADVDNIVAYVNDEVAKSKAPKAEPVGESAPISNNAIIFGINFVILAVIALFCFEYPYEKIGKNSMSNSSNSYYKVRSTVLE